MKHLNITSGALAALLFSCNIAPNEATIKEFYPIDSLVEAQVNYFVAHNATLSKGNTDSTGFELGVLLDSTHWAQELELFHNININKPTLVDAYAKGIYADDKSNLDILSYSTTDEKLSIKQINIYHLKSLKDIKRITIEVNNANTLYSNAQSLQMEFIKREQLTVLNKYTITGNQKMAMRDSISVSIVGKILF